MKLLTSRKGATFVLTAILLPVLLACMGIAVDLGRLYAEKARLQNLADAAVLAGLAEIKKDQFYVEGSGQLTTYIPVGALSDNTIAEIREKANAAADEYLLKNSGDEYFKTGHGGTKATVYRLKNSDPTATTYTYIYEIILRKEYPLYFGHIVYPHDMLVRAGAVCKFDITESQTWLGYAYALENWATMDKYHLLTEISSAQRLHADQEALRNLANTFLGKTKSEIQTILGKTSFNDYPFGHYIEGVDENGNVSTKFTPYTDLTNLTPNKLATWLQGSDIEQTYDSSKRYLFSDYAVQKTDNNGNGLKLTIKYKKNSENVDVVSSVQFAINPRDAANGSEPLNVTVTAP